MISIIITHFNRPNELFQCIDSFQDLKNKEIIIVDDKSDTQNISLIKKHLNKIKNNQIFFIESKDKNFLGGARNQGLKIAKGDWIFFIDDDDKANKKFIKFLNEQKLDENIDFYRFPYLKVNNKGKVLSKVKNIFPKSNKYSFQISTYIFNTFFLQKNNLHFEKNMLSEDLIFNMFIYQYPIKQKYVKNIYSINYSSDNISITRKKWTNTLEHEKVINFILQQKTIKQRKTYALYTLIWIYYLINNNQFENQKEAIQELKKLKKQIAPSSKDYLRLNWFHYFKSLKMRIKY